MHTGVSKLYLVFGRYWLQVSVLNCGLGHVPFPSLILCLVEFGFNFLFHCGLSHAPFPSLILELSFDEHYSYSVLLIESKDQEGQSQVLSAALEVGLYIPTIF